MKQKYTLPWRIFFGIYGLYFFIFLISLVSSYSLEAIIYNVVLLVAHLIGVASLYLYLEDIRFKINRFIGLVVFLIYLLIALANSLIILGIAFFNPDIFFGYMPVSLIDLLPLPLLIVSIYPVYRVLWLFKFRKINFKNFLWGLYACISLLFVGFSIVAMFFEISKWTIYDYLTAITVPIFMLPLFMFITKRMFLTQKFWKIIFAVSVVWSSYDFIYNLGLKNLINIPDQFESFSKIDIPYQVVIIVYIIALPYYYAFYKVAFDKKFFKHD